MTCYVPGTYETDLKKINLSLGQLAAGRSNAVGTVTCSTLSSTTVEDDNCADGSQPQLTASTSNAAAALGSTWVSSVANGEFVVSHTVASTTDRTFRYAIIG